MKDTSRAFLEAEALLRKYGFAHQAELVRNGLTAVQTQGHEGYRALATGDWWGGSGSVADVYLHSAGETFTIGQEKDNRALRAALVSICEAMRTAGVVFEGAESWASTLKQRRNDGI